MTGHPVGERATYEPDGGNPDEELSKSGHRTTLS